MNLNSAKEAAGVDNNQIIHKRTFVIVQIILRSTLSGADPSVKAPLRRTLEGQTDRLSVW